MIPDKTTLPRRRRDAIAIGSIYYWNPEGKPCPYGHDVPRYTNNSMCSDCRRIKDRVRMARWRDRRREHYRTYQREYQRRYYELHYKKRVVG